MNTMTTILLKKGCELEIANDKGEAEIISRLNVESIGGVRFDHGFEFVEITNLQGQTFFIPAESIAIMSETKIEKKQEDSE